MVAEQIIDHTRLRYVINISHLEILNASLLHQLQCGTFTYAAEHLTELFDVYNVGIVLKFLLIILSFCHINQLHFQSVSVDSYFALGMPSVLPSKKGKFQITDECPHHKDFLRFLHWKTALKPYAVYVFVRLEMTANFTEKDVKSSGYWTP